jgi:hypothetical protein
MRIMRMENTIRFIALVAVAAACSANGIVDSGETPNGELEWRVGAQHVEITNATAAEIRYAVIGREHFRNAAALWCFGKEGCGKGLAPGATASVAYSEIEAGGTPETEVLIIWWVPQPTVFVPFDSVVVRIR